MKMRNFGPASIALAGALAFTPAVSHLWAQGNDEPRQQQTQQKTQVFVGKIIKARNGQYALLTDEQNGKGAYLDDQEKAKSFEGKNVKVTGVFDVAKNMIVVTDIENA